MSSAQRKAAKAASGVKDGARLADVVRQAKNADRAAKAAKAPPPQAMNPIPQPGRRTKPEIVPSPAKDEVLPYGWAERIRKTADGKDMILPDAEGRLNQFVLDDGTVVNEDGQVQGMLMEVPDTTLSGTPMEQRAMYQSLADAIIAATGPSGTVSPYHLERVLDALEKVPAEHRDVLLGAISPDPTVAKTKLAALENLAGSDIDQLREYVRRANEMEAANALRVRESPDALDMHDAEVSDPKYAEFRAQDMAKTTLPRSELPTLEDDRRGRLLENLSTAGTFPSRHFIDASGKSAAQIVKARIQQQAGLPGAFEAPGGLRKIADRQKRYDKDDSLLRNLRSIQNNPDMDEAQKQAARLALADEYAGKVQDQRRRFEMSAAQAYREGLKTEGGYPGPADPVVDESGNMVDGAGNVDRVGEDAQVGAALSSPEARQALEELIDGGTARRAQGGSRPGISRRHQALGGAMTSRPRSGYSKTLRIEGIEVDPRLLTMYAPSTPAEVSAMAGKVMEFSDEFNYPGGRQDLESQIAEEVRVNGYSPLLHSEDLVRAQDVPADYPDRTPARDMLRFNLAKTSRERFGNPSVAGVAPESRGSVRRSAQPNTNPTAVTADSSSLAAEDVGDGVTITPDEQVNVLDDPADEQITITDDPADEQVSITDDPADEQITIEDDPADRDVPPDDYTPLTEGEQMSSAQRKAAQAARRKPASTAKKATRGSKAAVPPVDDGPKGTQVAPLPGEPAAPPPAAAVTPPVTAAPPAPAAAAAPTPTPAPRSRGRRAAAAKPAEPAPAPVAPEPAPVPADPETVVVGNPETPVAGGVDMETGNPAFDSGAAFGASRGGAADPPPPADAVDPLAAERAADEARMGAAAADPAPPAPDGTETRAQRIARQARALLTNRNVGYGAAALAGGAAILGAMGSRPYVPVTGDETRVPVGGERGVPMGPQDLLDSGAPVYLDSESVDDADLPMTLDRARAVLNAIQSVRGGSPRLHTLQNFH